MFKKAVFLALLLSLVGSAVYAQTWTYKFPISVMDTSNAARSYYPVDLGFGAQSLVDSGKLNSNALNSTMLIGGSSIKYMMGSTKVMAVIPTLLANENKELDLYTGYSVPQTNFPIIVGDGGYVTTADNAAIEMGSNFAMEFSGYIDSSAGANKDLLLKTSAIRFYISAASTITGTITGGSTVSNALASGVHTVKLYADGVNLKLDIDSVNVQSVGLGGVGVPDNANNIILDQNEVMPYIDYFTLTVGGVEKVKYQPNTMVLATALVNLDSAGAYPGVITFGSNTSITLHYDVLQGSGVTGSLLTQSGGFSMPNSVLPSTWFANGENVASLPFYDSFNEVAGQLGEPVTTIYFLALIGFAFGVFLLIATTIRSVLLGALAFNIVLFVGSSMTIVPMWLPFIILLIQVGIMYLYRQVAI